MVWSGNRRMPKVEFCTTSFTRIGITGIGCIGRELFLCDKVLENRLMATGYPEVILNGRGPIGGREALF